jgi:hypothetical protein
MAPGDHDPLHALPLGSPEWLAELQRRFPRAYAHWTDEEEQRLIDAFRAGKSSDEIAAVHGRTPQGIMERLVCVGIFDEPTASRTRRDAPTVLCDGCEVALDEYDIFCFWRDASGGSADYLELCAACLCAAMRSRTSGPST